MALHAEANVIHVPRPSTNRSGIRRSSMSETIARQFRFRRRSEDAETEHLNPVAHRVVAIVERRHPVEVPRRAHFESIPLEQTGVFPDAREIPRIRVLQPRRSRTVFSRCEQTAQCFALPPNSATNRPQGADDEAML